MLDPGSTLRLRLHDARVVEEEEQTPSTPGTVHYCTPSRAICVRFLLSLVFGLPSVVCRGVGCAVPVSRCITVGLLFDS